MIFRSLFLGALLVSGPALHAAEWSADTNASSLNFSGTAEGVDFTGQFKQFEPSIHFDATDLSTARFDVDIELSSADTRDSDRDDTLKGSDFFHIKQFPSAKYTATSFRALGDNRFAADGTLSLRGIEKPVTLEFSWVEENDTARLEGTATVNRLQFDVGAGDWSDASTISHDIGVSTSLNLTKSAGD